jgi:cyclic-di-GMP phosphodiesterase TipF (flagellum assembly factor)
MPLIAHALFYAAYGFVALATGLGLSTLGGAELPAAVTGGLSLFAAFAVTHAALTAAHATGAVKATEKRLSAEIERVRTLHKEQTRDISAIADRLDALDGAVGEMAQRQALAPPPQPAQDVKALESLVDRLGKSLDARLDAIGRLAAPTASPAASALRGPIDIVREAINENRIELHLQPIVALPQRRTAFYEGFTRLKDEHGRLLLPRDFMPAAEKAGLMGAIDNLLLFRAVQIVRKLSKQDRRIGIFCNLSPRSLADDAFFPQFLDFMIENRDMAGAVIFELPHDAFAARTSVEARAMARLADIGYRFSIDRIPRIEEIDLVDMERAGVKFAKVAAEILQTQLVEDGARPRSNIARELSAADVSAVMRRYGVELIAERIEGEDAVREVLDLEIAFAQGNLFGAARAIKDSLMEETAPPKDFIQRMRG